MISLKNHGPLHNFLGIEATFEDMKLYRSIVGALQYVTITRPELTFSINKIFRYMYQPKEHH